MPQSSSSFELLHADIKRWIWEKGWQSLHDSQERAIPVILNANKDVLICANTAAGKTEAAFLPILTALLESPADNQLVIQICPTKALINDQLDRLGEICGKLNIAVNAWHGDVDSNKKSKFRENPSGILIITPESIEAIFVNRGSQAARIFAGARYIVIDEIHSFIGSERGRQLASLIHRIELAVSRFIPRVALSATIGDLHLAAKFLRADRDVEIINSPESGGRILLSVKAFFLPDERAGAAKDVTLNDDLSPGDSACDVAVDSDDTDDEENEEVLDDINEIARHIYVSTRDSKNLIFPNSRQNVEYYADMLRSLSEADGRENSYWPHHGSLSKDFREVVEGYMNDLSRPSNPVATSTLEAGLDFPSVKSIAQVGVPPSVSSLKQRAGRSGRGRGESPILRLYARCKFINAKSKLIERFHPELIQIIATVQLLLRGWYEPPKVNYCHLSTLVHQLLSVVAQHSGRTASALYQDLVVSGPHKGLSKSEFKELILNMGDKSLLCQDEDGTLLLGKVGELHVNNYEFYSVFPLSDEFRIECKGKTIGTIVKNVLLSPGQNIVFAGRRWCIVNIRLQDSVMEVTPTKGGQVVSFGGVAAQTHSVVREEMRNILTSDEIFPYLDKYSNFALMQARQFFNDSGLCEACMYQSGSELFLFTWKGDEINQTLAFVLSQLDLEICVGGFFIVISNANANEVLFAFEHILKIKNIESLFDKVKFPVVNRWDWALPSGLLKKDFLARNCDIKGCTEFIIAFLEKNK